MNPVGVKRRAPRLGPKRNLLGCDVIPWGVRQFDTIVFPSSSRQSWTVEKLVFISKSESNRRIYTQDWTVLPMILWLRKLGFVSIGYFTSVTTVFEQQCLWEILSDEGEQCVIKIVSLGRFFLNLSLSLHLLPLTLWLLNQSNVASIIGQYTYSILLCATPDNVTCQERSFSSQ